VTVTAADDDISTNSTCAQPECGCFNSDGEDSERDRSTTAGLADAVRAAAAMLG
jgi:hypothetical protein